MFNQKAIHQNSVALGLRSFLTLHYLPAWLMCLLVLSMQIASVANAQQHAEPQPFQCELYRTWEEPLPASNDYPHKAMPRNSDNNFLLTCQDQLGMIYDLQHAPDNLLSSFVGVKQTIANTARQAGSRNTTPPILTISGHLLQSGRLIFTPDSEWSVTVPDSITRKQSTLDIPSTARAAAVVEHTVLVLHVTANDGTSKGTPAELSDAVFGTNGDPVNLKSMYHACSYGSLKMVPATGDHIVDGVSSVTIDMNVNGASRGDVRTAITTAAINQLGSDVFNSFDHVMYMYPDGALKAGNGWVAVAVTNGQWSLYNYDYNHSVSAHMHEVGHNIGMGHSNENGIGYEDITGQMGYSASQSDTPKKCFNGVKSSYFGWYAGKEISFNPNDWNQQPLWQGSLVGITDYRNASASQQVLVKLRTQADVDNQFISLTLNRKAGIHIDTGEAEDKVTVTEDGGESTSSLLGKLGAGESYIYENYPTAGSNLVIKVNTIALDANNVLAADVDICVQGQCPNIVVSDSFETL